jgi:hypothetical protein
LNRHVLLMAICAVVLGSLPVAAQEPPPFGRLIIASTSRWGDGLSGVVQNLGPGKMCNVVIQANTFVEDLPGARVDYGSTKIVTQDLGTLYAEQESSFSLNSVFVKGRMPGLFATGAPCR